MIDSTPLLWLLMLTTVIIPHFVSCSNGSGNPVVEGPSSSSSSSTASTILNPPSHYSPAKPSFLYLLIDDVGWADLSYNGGIAKTPNLDAWAKRAGSMKFQDFHSYTVCSPTRASILTGRNHFRDCVDYVYGCDDMTNCVPNFEFAPSKTYTVGDAVRNSASSHNNAFIGNPLTGVGLDNDYKDGVYFAGKWHLGSFYNDSEAYGGKTSSPKTHGFDHFNATVEVAPTMTLNCQCKDEWEEECQFGHNPRNEHCTPHRPCCFNYWWDDAKSPHGVANLTWPTESDDALYLVDAFQHFLSKRKHQGHVRGGGPPAPFFAQISFHNCHIPFVGSSESKETCANNLTCVPPAKGEPPYTDRELDYYACLTQLDNAVGQILQTLEEKGYYENTMIWFSSDNGPEWNCPPEGICKRASDSQQRPVEGPGTAGPLRGRKRDIYEGGHRVPAIISWPAYIGTDQTDLVSWEIVSTTDFLPTIMDILGVERPPSQSSWAMDGRSILPLLKGGGDVTWSDTDDGIREWGIGYYDAKLLVVHGWGYRYGKWKYVEGSASCKVEECKKPQLFDLENDLGERNDLSDEYPELLLDIQSRFFLWYQTIQKSRSVESKCTKVQDLQLPLSLRNDVIK